MRKDLLLCATALLFSACHSNNNASDGNTASNPIIGTWQLESQRTVMLADGIVISDNVLTRDESSVPTREVEFNNDGSYTDQYALGVINGEWSLLDDGGYSLDGQQTADLIQQYAEDQEIEVTQYAPATAIAILIDNQTLGMQETVYYSVVTEDRGKVKIEVEKTSKFVRIR